MSVAAETPSEKAVFAKAAWRLIPLLFLCYILAYLDRVNVGFAKLQMASDLQFSDAVYGFGAGVFFIGYFLFEVPSNLILQKVGARIWIARIMITWGIISSCFMFTHLITWGGFAQSLGFSDAELTFYTLRFLLGIAEAGFFPGVILYLTYWFPGQRRAQMVALFMTAIALSNVVGGPLSGAIMQYTDGMSGWRGWQWLFLLEGIPSVVVGCLIFILLPEGPHKAKWLNDEERGLIAHRLAEENATKSGKHRLIDAFSDWRIWVLCIVYFSHNVCIYAVSFWMPTLIQEFGFQSGEYFKIGLIAAIPWGISGIVSVLWARHSDRTGERRWHAVTGLLVALVGCLLLALFAENAYLSILGLTCVTTGVGSYVVIFWSLPTAILSGTAAAAGIAWINSIGNLGGYFGPEMIGRIRDANNGDASVAFFAMAGFALLGATIVSLLPGLPKPRKA